MTRLTYDHDAMQRRTAAVMGFLDLSLDEWQAWLVSGDSDRLPPELEPMAVAAIMSLRGQAADPADESTRASYLQVVAALSSDVLEVLAREVRGSD